MSKKVKMILFILTIMLLFGIVFNRIFAETTNGTTTTTSEETNIPKYLKNIGKPYEGKEYIVGNVNNDAQGDIEIDDATQLLAFIANSLAWDYEKNPVNNDYEIYVKLVEKKIIKNNENIKNVEDLYNICDVNEDKVISVQDVQEILTYYVCKAVGFVKD